MQKNIAHNWMNIKKIPRFENEGLSIPMVL